MGTTYLSCLSRQLIMNTFFLDDIGANYDKVRQSSAAPRGLTVSASPLSDKALGAPPAVSSHRSLCPRKRFSVPMCCFWLALGLNQNKTNRQQNLFRCC